VSTIAGLGGSEGSVDGTGSAARFIFPYTIAVENAGTLFVSDSYNTTPTIRKLTLIGANWVVSTIPVVVEVVSRLTARAIFMWQADSVPQLMKSPGWPKLGRQHHWRAG